MTATGDPMPEHADADTSQRRGSSFEPILMLASALQAVPASHAVVLGAGVSIAAGVPSAWGVQEELIRRIATGRGDEAPDSPHDWYRGVFEEDATYEGVLERLAPTQHERQAILRRFFEPDLNDEENEMQQPTKAHIALARLAKSGHLRVFVTLNFDHLMERALRSEGIEPTVVRSLQDLAGLAPVHTIACLVVHLHGDYLTATTMRNTTSELAGYEEPVTGFLRPLLHDHALLIVGWSAEHDPALRGEVSRSLLERYTSYWVTPGQLESRASDLATTQRIHHVSATADETVPRLADAVAALEARQARHPHSLADAIGAVKREISGRPVAVGVHDRLRTALEELWDHPDLNLPDFNREPRPYRDTVARLTEATMTAAALVAATSYWGDERTDAWWMQEMRRFSVQFRGSGQLNLMTLPQVVGTLLFHAAGVAAVAAGRFSLARALFVTHVASDDARHGTLPERLHAAGWTPEAWDSSTAIMEQLAPIFAEHLALGPYAYEDAWELFDLLTLAQRLTGDERFADARTEYLTTQGETVRLGEAAASSNPGDQISRLRDKAIQDRDQALGFLAGLVWPEGCHVRVVRHDFRSYRSARAESLIRELERNDQEHPLIKAGFASRSASDLQVALMAVSIAVGSEGNDVSRRVAARSRTSAIPSDFWLDTGATPLLR